VLDAGAAQDALGWHGTVRFVEETGLSGRLVADLADSKGAPIRDVAVKVALVRPIEPMPEQDLTLSASGQGSYAAPLTIARAGQWEVRVTAARGSDVYQFVQRIVVR
jgi:nitrogen fixation protein FixH